MPKKRRFFHSLKIDRGALLGISKREIMSRVCTYRYSREGVIP